MICAEEPRLHAHVKYPLWTLKISEGDTLGGAENPRIRGGREPHVSIVASQAAVIWENLSQTYKRLCITNYFFDSSFPLRSQSILILSVNFKLLRCLSTCSYPTQTATHSFSALICTIYQRRST